MARQERVCVFICLGPVCSIMRIKGKQAATGTGSRQLSQLWHTHVHKRSRWLCLVLLEILFLLPYLAKMDTNGLTIGACQRWKQDRNEWCQKGFSPTKCEAGYTCPTSQNETLQICSVCKYLLSRAVFLQPWHRRYSLFSIAATYMRRS